MSLPIRVTMEDGTEILLIRRDGIGVRNGRLEGMYFRCWQASTPPEPERAHIVIAFGVTEEAAIAALLGKLQGRAAGTGD